MFKTKSLRLVAVLAVALLGTWLALQGSAVLSGVQAPDHNPFQGLVQVFSGRRKSTVLTWIFLGLAFIATIAVAALYPVESAEGSSLAEKNRLMKAHKVAATAEAKNLSQVADVNGLDLGTIVGSKDHAIQSWESCSLTVTGARMGKTTGSVIPNALQAPGAYFFTSNKPDGVAEIVAARSGKGNVWIFDPEGVLPKTRTNEVPWMQWNLWSRIRDKSDAEIVVDILDLSSKQSGDGNSVTSSDSFFDPKGKKLAVALLLMAAQEKMSIYEMYSMAVDGNLAGLESMVADKLPLMALEVRGVANLPDKTRDSVLGGLEKVLAPLANDMVTPWIEPDGSAEVFEPAEFVRSRDTLIVMVKSNGTSAAALSSLLVDAVCAAGVEAAAPRLDPPLVGDLDETNNTVHIHDLPDRYTYYGSRGIVLNAYLQNFAAGKRLWGKEGFESLRSAATVKIFGGGVDDKPELADVSALIGKYERTTHSVSYNSGRSTMQGRKTSSQSKQWHEIMTVDELNNQPRYQTVVRIAGFGSAVVRRRPWFDDEQFLAQVPAQAVASVSRSLGIPVQGDVAEEKVS